MKKILMTLAAAGLMLTGCTKNETEGLDVPDPDVISFSTTTSRAVIADLSTLTAAAGGFRVYGTTNGGSTWHTNVNGENNYVYANSNWGWAGTNAEWPTGVTAYPMNFYAMFPADAPTTASEGTNPSLSRTVTIADTAAEQTDLLAAKAEAPAKPASGKLTMTFDHILSKVNFGVIAGHNMAPVIQTVKINNVNNANTYNYILHGWGGTSNGSADYSYFQNTASPFTTTGDDTNEEAAVPFYTAPKADSVHLMLMPQAQGAGAPFKWDLTATTLADSAYIEVIYRITDVTTPDTPSDYIGYTAGGNYLTDFPAYAEENPGWGTYTGLGDGNGTTYNDALFIRVGFPVIINWTPGKGYTYNICLGTADSTNGYYIDDTYYDKDGADTSVPIIGPDDGKVEPGDPVTSGIINFEIKVANWDDTTPTILQ